MISLQNISKRYATRGGSREILKSVTIKIQAGEKIGILGRNGAGKSTLIRLISGAELPTTGQIHRGMSISWPLAFGGGFQGSLTGFDNVRFICRIYNKEISSAMDFVQDFSELGSFLREPVKHYSSGMRARLAFAISMAIEFDCFLIDEIVAVGDDSFQEKCRVELFERRKDRAIILVSHNPLLIRQYCQRVALLADGALSVFENIDEAFEVYHRHPSVLVRS